MAEETNLVLIRVFVVVNVKNSFIFSRCGKLYVSVFIQHCFICRTSDQLSLDDTEMNDFRFFRQGSTQTSSPKKFICKGTLPLVFIRAYRLEIKSVMLVFGIFDPAL